MRLLALTLALGCLAAPALADTPVISAGHDVLAAMVRNIASPGVTVVVPVPEGTDPAAFTPDIATIAAIQQADVIVLNGAGYESWATRVSLPRARTVDTTAAMQQDLIHRTGLTHSHGTGPAHSHDGLAPVVWLDFTLAARQAQAVAAGLTRRFPDATDAHAANLARLDQRLSGLDDRARAIGTALADRTLLVAHPGYEYLGRAYGIALQETTLDADAPATPDQLRALDAALAQGGTPVMLWKATPPAATQAALDARGVTAVVLPDGAQTPDGQDPFDLIAAGLTDLALALAIPATTP